MFLSLYPFACPCAAGPRDASRYVLLQSTKELEESLLLALWSCCVKSCLCPREAIEFLEWLKAALPTKASGNSWDRSVVRAHLLCWMYSLPCLFAPKCEGGGSEPT